MSDIKVDVSSITPEAQYQLAKGCLEFYFSIVSQPGGRERLDAWKAEHEKTIEKVLHELHWAFDDTSVEQAEKIYCGGEE